MENEFDYTFSFKKAPSSSEEITHIKRLANSLTSNPEVLVQYIDWIFKEKVSGVILLKTVG